MIEEMPDVKNEKEKLKSEFCFLKSSTSLLEFLILEAGLLPFASMFEEILSRRGIIPENYVNIFFFVLSLQIYF